MTIEEAIVLLGKLIAIRRSRKYPRHRQALNLGIAALSRLKYARDHHLRPVSNLLPGESFHQTPMP